MSQSGDVEKVIRNAVLQGFKYSKTSRGHHQLLAPNGHDIVHHSGTPSDTRGFYNFLAQLKRAGYMELQTLGDAISEASKAPAEIKTPGANLSITQHIIELLSRHPEGMSPADIKAYIKSVKPDVKGADPQHTALHILKNRGMVKAPDHRGGRYILITTEKKKPEKVEAKSEILDFSKLDTGDKTLNKDLKALDEAINDALVALTKIDSLVRKQKETLIKFAKLRDLFK